eukprot:TRINITY_DN47346_c0_g1_i1.p4 TRINITY_DN47346_c0_g1~~TRINITY_DN47346_c0_g1_i1.p4  ORF type:complete len:225 (-),score=54.63 TRINITY_DN47346_c0_g1_i1:249-923(-)
MARDGDILFSVITPSTGRRPKALGQAVKSVEQAARFAGLDEGQVEILIGFDGKKSRAPACGYPVHAFNLPGGKDRGNGIRNMLLKVAAGDKLLFLDDDNTIKPKIVVHGIRLDGIVVVQKKKLVPGRHLEQHIPDAVAPVLAAWQIEGVHGIAAGGRPALLPVEAYENFHLSLIQTGEPGGLLHGFYRLPERLGPSAGGGGDYRKEYIAVPGHILSPSPRPCGS